MKKIRFEKTKRERFPRKLKKAILKEMSRPAFHALMEWNYDYFGGNNPLDWYCYE